MPSNHGQLIKRLDILIELLTKQLSRSEVALRSQRASISSEQVEAPDLSDSSAEPPKKKNKTGMVHVPPPCAGCDDFACCLAWRVMDHLPKDAETWMRGHGMFAEGRCPAHPEARMRRVGAHLECAQRVSPDNVCRKRVSPTWPLLSTASKLSPDQLLKIYAHVAGGDGVLKISRQMNLNHNTIGRQIDLLGRAALRKAEEPSAFNKVAVDETFIGKRKDHRGKKPRKRVYWFATATEILRDGSCGRTVWKLVRRRDAKTLTAFIDRHIAGSKSVVWSDEHRGYLRLGDICRHAAVCHKKEFKTEAGVHTNNAECAHGVIKTFCKECHHRVGISSRNVRKNVALQCLRFLEHRVPEEQSWGARVQALLQCVKRYHRDPDEEDSLETMSSDTEPETLPKEVVLPRSGSKVRLTNKGLPDKRSRPKESREECEAVEEGTEEPPRKKASGDALDPSVERRRKAAEIRDGTVGDAEAAQGLILGKEDNEDVMQSLRPGKYILHTPIQVAISNVAAKKKGWRFVDIQRGHFWLEGSGAPPTEHDLPMNNRILWPLYYSNHWILAVIDYKHRSFEVYDSLRGYAHPIRKNRLYLVSKVLHKVWAKWIKPHLRQCEQQGDGSNDCGLHVVNNALRLMGDDARYTRDSLRDLWKKSVAKPTNNKKAEKKKPVRRRMSEVESLRAMETCFGKRKKSKQ